MKESGFLYIYTSNESPQDVFFDNVILEHITGPVLEETHYYPFGLTMDGISTKVLGELVNKRGYNGNELQKEEWNDGSGLELYDFNARTYDQQIGRFMQIDPMTEEGGQESLSTYHYAFNNPVTFGDPDGKFPFPFAFWAMEEILKNPNSKTSKAIGVVAGTGQFISKTVEGAYNMVTHPVQAAEGIAELGTPWGQLEFGLNLVNTIEERANTIQNGTGFASFAAGTETFWDVASVIAGSKGIGTVVKGENAAVKMFKGAGSGINDIGAVGENLTKNILQKQFGSGAEILEQVTVRMDGASMRADFVVVQDSKITGVFESKVNGSDLSNGQKLFFRDGDKGVLTGANAQRFSGVSIDPAKIQTGIYRWNSKSGTFLIQ